MNTTVYNLDMLYLRGSIPFIDCDFLQFLNQPVQVVTYHCKLAQNNIPVVFWATFHDDLMTQMQSGNLEGVANYKREIYTAGHFLTSEA